MSRSGCRLSLFFACLFLFCLSGFGQHLPYKAGYCELQHTDSARRYQPLATPGNALYYRPVQVDVWYPAKSGGKTPLDYWYFLSLFERRANEYQTETRYDSIGTEMLNQFTESDSVAPAKMRTHTLPNAKPAAGKFPVIVYLCAYNGMSYENVALFEQLAQSGYYVLSISSVGRYPGNMSTRYEDVLEQAQDAAFAVSRLNTNMADTSRIGVIGYSYGGLAGILLVNRLPGVRCFLSLEGSEKHYYGRDRQEDADFDDCRTKGNLSLPAGCFYAYLESDHKTRDGKTDSLFTPKGAASGNYSRLADAEHEDFSYIAMLGKSPSAVYPRVINLVKSYTDQMLMGKASMFGQQLQALISARKAFSQPEYAPVNRSSIQLSGKVTDTHHQPIAYASIGITDADAGTISNKEGDFFLQAADSLMSRMVRVSAIGYRAVTLPASRLKQQMAQQGVIMLIKDVKELPAVTVSVARPQYKTVGRTSTSKFFSVGFPYTDLGSEVGVMLSLGKQNVLLQSFNYHVSYNRMDSCTFRLNIYTVINGLPAQNLLSQSIITCIGNQSGSYSINLQPYHLLLSGNVCVALEWIAGSTGTKNGAVFFSGGLLSSSYHRKAAQGRWAKLKGLGAAFNVKVQKL